MKITLDINDDIELRSHVKSLVRTQLLAIAREEYITIIQEELVRKVKNISDQDFKNIIREIFQGIARQVFFEREKAREWDYSWVKPHIEDIINKLVVKQDWEHTVKAVLASKISNLLTK